MLHIELHQFPHVARRFNLTQEEVLREIARTWSEGGWIEVGERKWSPHQARLTIVEAPRLTPNQLTMGRGWRAAQRAGQDVTERVLAIAAADRGSAKTESVQSGDPSADGDVGGDSDHHSQSGDQTLCDALALGILTEISGGSEPVGAAWTWARGRHTDLSLGRALDIAIGAARSLLDSSLVIFSEGPGAEDRHGRDLPDEEARGRLAEIDTWTATNEESIWMRRA